MQVHPTITHEDWLQSLPPALAGIDGILFGRASGPRSHRAVYGPWKILQRVDHADDHAKAKAQAEDDLMHGADGLILSSVEVLPVFASMPLHRIHLRNEAADGGAEGLRSIIARLPIDPARMDIDFGAHDIDVIKAIHGDGFVSPLMKADGRVGHAHGLNHAEELGSVLAVALSNLRKLEFLDDAPLAKAVSVTLAATQDPFSTLAKFRAARILWRELLNAVGLPDAPLALHGETSRRMLAEVDPHSNILRSVTAAFGAGLGGADSFSVLPMSFMQGVPNAFARRVARNLQLLLLQESQLWRVDDPAAGAGAIETRTQKMCDEAWSVMQACERGDWPVGDRNGSFAEPVIGVRKYVNAIEAAPEIEGA